ILRGPSRFKTELVNSLVQQLAKKIKIALVQVPPFYPHITMSGIIGECRPTSTGGNGIAASITALYSPNKLSRRCCRTQPSFDFDTMQRLSLSCDCAIRLTG